MSVLKSDIVRFDELGAALDCLAPHSSGLSQPDTLALWKRWHRDGTLRLGRVDRVLADGSRQTQALGITLWITDAAVQALSQATDVGCTQRLYRAAWQGLHWVMSSADIKATHDNGALNLMVLHFWSRGDVSSPDFQPVFLQAHMLFRDLHQGFGVKGLYQEVTLMEAPFLAAAGMDVVHSGLDTDPASGVWMCITKAQATVKSGSTFSFLFFSPPRRLALPPAVQRMLALAVRQITDDEIAAGMGCSRDYVRQLWSQAYDCMEQTGVLMATPAPATGSAQPVRGRERRRTAIEFLRTNPHEMRPGLLLPSARRGSGDSAD